MNDKTVAQRIKRMTEKRKAQGLKQVRVWIPVEMEVRLKEVADALKEGRHVIIQNERLDPVLETPDQG